MNAQIGEELVRYSGGHEVFRHGSALGKHTEVFNAEMAGLSAAKKFILNSDPNLKPTHVIFYADNSSAISKIFEGLYGQAQEHSRNFRRTIGEILNDNPDSKVAISWGPGHTSITGNNKAD